MAAARTAIVKMVHCELQPLDTGAFLHGSAILRICHQQWKFRFLTHRMRCPARRAEARLAAGVQYEGIRMICRVYGD
jgi:hypothetical protein